MNVRLALLAGAVLALPSGAAFAHHSFAGIYDQSREVQFTGTVREFLFVHPHPFLRIDVRMPDGSTRTLRGEMDNRFELEDIGVTGMTFVPGDTVTITGSPGRAQADILYLWKVERPADGLLYEQIGMTPRLTRRR